MTKTLLGSGQRKGPSQSKPSTVTMFKSPKMERSTPQQGSLGPRLLRLRDTLSNSGQPLPDNTAIWATVGILLLEHDPDLETLLIQRTERHDDPWSGQIGLPGGRVKNSESVRSALHREVEEEVGVDLTKYGEELGSLSIGAPMRRLELKVQPWVYGLKRQPSVTIGPEVDSAFWVSLPGLPEKQAKREVVIRGESRTVDCFLVDSRIVWGYTYRVLTELLSLPGVLTGP